MEAYTPNSSQSLGFGPGFKQLDIEAMTDTMSGGRDTGQTSTNDSHPFLGDIIGHRGGRRWAGSEDPIQDILKNHVEKAEYLEERVSERKDR